MHRRPSKQAPKRDNALDEQHLLGNVVAVFFLLATFYDVLVSVSKNSF